MDNLPCGPGHDLTLTSCAKLGLKPLSDDAKPWLVVLRVIGFDKMKVLVKNAVVDTDSLELDGVPVPRGTRNPEFTMLPEQCCPIAQRQIRVAGGNAQFPGGAWGIQEFPEGTKDPHVQLMEDMQKRKDMEKPAVPENKITDADDLSQIDGPSAPSA